MTDERPERPLRIMITLLHPGYARNYEGVLRLLLGRGHHVRLLVLQRAKQATDRVGERLGEEFGNLMITAARKPERDGWRNLRTVVRLLIDYSRYLHPRYRDAPALRARVVEKMFGVRRDVGIVLAATLTFYVWVLGRFRGARYSDALITGLLHLERAIPPSRRIDEAITNFAPDAVISTPYVAVGSREPDYLRSAKRLGIRTGLFVASWDNLTNKGLIKTVPDRVFMWNEAQRQEARELHRIPDANIVVTGAQRFDPWFEQQPYWDDRAFSEMVGLDPDRPYVLYLCSSPFIAPNEVSFVERLLTEIRGGDSAIRDVGFLVRPHPQNAKQWIEADISHFGNAVIWPPAGEQPVNEVARAGFYDSMAHSAAVVGINTSAQIEAGIVGRTVHTILDPQFAHTQEGTLHFHHLLAENGGLLHVATSTGELVENLERAVSGELDEEQTHRFVESFVRPHGRDVPATPIFADAVEALARMPAPEPEPRTLTDRTLRAALTPLALIARPISWSRMRKRVLELRGSEAAEERMTPERQAKRNVHRACIAVSKGGRPTIVIGPYLHDAAHELLYWIPFLRWATQTYGLESSRLVAASRGGTRQWYRNICDRHVDALDLVDHAVYQRAVHGQAFADVNPGKSSASALDALLERHLRAELGSDIRFLRPELVHDLLRRVWSGRASMRFAEQFLDVRTLHAAADPELAALLPAEYLTAQFSFSPALPDTPGNREMVRRVVDRLAAHAPVVLLGPALGDGGVEVLIAESPGVVRLLEDTDPSRSLEIQSYAISRSRGFVGTCGSLSQVAVSHGVSAVDLYSAPNGVRSWTIDMTDRVARLTGAEFTVVHADAAELLAASFGAPAPTAR